MQPDPGSARRSFRERLHDGDTYGLLLMLIVVTYFVMAFVGTSHWAHVALSIAFAGVMLLTLRTSHIRGRWTKIVVAFGALVVAINVAQAIIDDDSFTVFTYLWIAFVVASPIVILYRILRHPSVDLETILGAICSYLLIGIAFAAVFGMLQDLGTKDFFAQPTPYEPIDFLYFSFIVLTTTGFGDYTPGTSVGKVLVTLEALIGQVYLVTIVASLVASFGLRRTAPLDAMPDPGGEPRGPHEQP